MTLALPALSGIAPFVDPRGAPYAVANLAADFDADALLDLLSDTDPVTTWADATGGGNDFGNTGANRPTFDAVNPQFNWHASVNFAITWTREKVIYDVDDADGRDFRGECGFICLKQGPHAGRLVAFTKWSADDSSIYVAGQRSTLLIGYSDDHGQSWTWLDPMQSDPDKDNWSYTASPNGLIEQQTGARAGRIIITFSTNSSAWSNTLDQDIRLAFSDDGGATWSNAFVIIEHDVEPAANVRITETCLVEWDDGDLSLFMRDDTNHYIWRAVGNVADLHTWTVDGAQLFAGWGRPTAIRDPNDPAGLYLFHRDEPTDLTVWRYSDDEGATWSAARAMSNLHATTGTVAGSYPAMSYCYPAVDSDGNLWLANGMEDGVDSDIFVRRWADAPAS